MKTWKILLCVFGLAARGYAEPIYYLDMVQLVTNVPPMCESNLGVRITGVTLTNVNYGAEATNLMNEFAADADYFGGTNDFAWDAYIHTHDYSPVTVPCERHKTGEHRSKQTAPDKWVTLTCDPPADPIPGRYQPEIWQLAVDDDTDAKRKQKKVEDRDKSKTFKVEKHL